MKLQTYYPIILLFFSFLISTASLHPTDIAAFYTLDKQRPFMFVESSNRTGENQNPKVITNIETTIFMVKLFKTEITNDKVILILDDVISYSVSFSKNGRTTTSGILYMEQMRHFCNKDSKVAVQTRLISISKLSESSFATNSILK